MDDDCNLFLQMESERAKIPNIVRNAYIPVFIVKCLHDKLEGKNYSDVKISNLRKSGRGHVLFGAYSNQTDDSMMWTDDTFLEENVDFEGVYFLPKENLNYVTKVLRFAKEAFDCFSLDKKGFGRYFTDEYEYPSLELLYRMDVQYNLLPVTGYMMWMRQPSQIKYFKEQFISFVFSPTAFHSENQERSTRILEHFLQCIILNHYCNPDNKPGLQKGKQLCGDILKEITVKLSHEESYTANPTNYGITLAMLKDVDVPNSVRIRYFSDNINVLLGTGKKPFLSGKEILRYQEQYADPKKPVELEALRLMISQMIRSTLSSTSVVQLISTKVKTTDFNWEMLLYLITIWIKDKENRASTLLKDFIKSLIRDGLSQRNENDVTAGFVLARHCSLVASTIFSRYEKWFTNMFESGVYSPANDVETFTFFTNTLTSWVPNEPSCFLHVHTTFYPFIPKGCREIWNDYVSVVKVRLLEYKEVEEAMEFEPNLNDPIQYEVEMAIKAFEKNGQVPQSILKMWIVKKQYYLKDFLPVLLRKPSGVPLTDAKLRFIELLRRDGKIPDEMYTNYKAAKTS